MLSSHNKMKCQRVRGYVIVQEKPSATAWENIRFTFTLPSSKQYWQVKCFLCSVLWENFKKDKWYLFCGYFLRGSNMGQSSEKKLQRWCEGRLFPFTETCPIWEWFWRWEKKRNIYFSSNKAWALLIIFGKLRLSSRESARDIIAG